MTLQEFYDLLEKHDWYYHFTDDGRVYQAGQRSLGNLRRLASENLDFKALLDAYETYIESPHHARIPKPLRPGGPAPKKFVSDDLF